MSSGRPTKYGEATIKREFRLPESLSELLTETARNRGINMSDIVVGALRRELQEEESPSTIVEGERQGYAFSLNRIDAKELEELASSFYMDDPQLFVQVLTRAALDAGPDAVKKLLYGRFDEEVEARLAEEENATKTKKPLKKAA